ncbi:MAG: urea ABC transporter permease subunit UrtB [Pseudomonadota bacterium]
MLRLFGSLHKIIVSLHAPVLRATRALILTFVVISSAPSIAQPVIPAPAGLADEAVTYINTYSNILQSFAANEDRETADLIAALALLEEPQVRTFLDTLLAGDVYVMRENPRVVIATRGEDLLAITDAITGAALGEVATRAVQRVSLNNSLRRTLRVLLADLDLESPDPAARLDAVAYLMSQGAEESKPKLEALLANEEDTAVLTQVTAALALLDLTSTDSVVRGQAIDAVDGNLNNAIRNALAEIAENDPDEALRVKARESLEGIADRIRWLGHLETLFFGISLGSVLLLAAIGLAITFGVMGVINMAHGELIMLGAYTTFVVQQLLPNHLEISIIVAIPAAFIVSALFGIAIERGVIRFLYGRPLETLLATFGISLILQQLVRTVFSPLNRSVSTPQWMSGQWQINEVLALNYNRLYIIIFCLLVFFLLSMLLKKTRLGIEVRAVAQNRAMARAIGVRSNRVDALTFGLGSGIAGIAGVALSQLTNVGPNMGQDYIVDSFMVVVFGGVGNLWGAFYSSFILGIVNKVLEPEAGAVLAKILILVFIILFIQRQPRGLFPAKGRGVED